MHRHILGLRALPAALVALALAGSALLTGAAPAAAPPSPADCPGRDAAILERFISADCTDCWAAAEAPAAGPPVWRLDWLAPTPSGVEAPMSAATLPESAERAQRAGGRSPIAQQMLTVRRPAGAAPKSVGMSLAVGPAWHGYFGVQADVVGTLPPGSSLWLALVEAIPAGSDGSPVARELVRSVAGPLTLNPSKGPNGKTKLNHLRAMRWPDSAKPERLQARGWIESTDGTLLAMASPRCPLR